MIRPKTQESRKRPGKSVDFYKTMDNTPSGSCCGGSTRVQTELETTINGAGNININNFLSSVDKD